MKNTILIPISLAAISIAFAFKSSGTNLADHQFSCDDPSTPFDPQSYSPTSLSPAQIASLCPGQGKVCMIVVPASDVYTTGPNADKPKVDIQTSAVGELQDDIQTALANASDPTFLHGRTIYERN